MRSRPTPVRTHEGGARLVKSLQIAADPVAHEARDTQLVIRFGLDHRTELRSPRGRRRRRAIREQDL